MDLCERLAGCDAVTTLAEADDPDGVVDDVFLRPPPGAEAEGGLADRDGTELGHVALAVRGQLVDDGCRRQCALARIAALRADPALVRREGGPVGDGLHRAHAALLLVDPEIGDREQP